MLVLFLLGAGLGSFSMCCYDLYKENKYLIDKLDKLNKKESKESEENNV